MREIKISVEPFIFINYTFFACSREVNEHGTLKITGLIEERRAAEYSKIAEQDTWVKVTVSGEEGAQEILFHGILTSFRISKKKGDSRLTIEAKTGSYLLDITEHTRSFQNGLLNYTDIVNKCAREAGGNVIILEKRGVPAENFYLQYRETDWAFLKRLAANANTVLIPEMMVSGKKFYFGCHAMKKEEDIMPDSYDMIRDYGEKNLLPSDAVSYVLYSREICKVGVNIRFQDRLWLVRKCLSRLEGGELYHEYHLIPPVLRCDCPKNNSKIRGVSLTAMVTAVLKTKVQVKILSDENKDGNNHKWFDYATVYSTPDGTGWYCMPEEGDEVRLTFPDETEENAYVSGSVHLDTQGGRSNPDYKSWKNKQNKEILFTPDSLLLRNNKGLILELSDREGIKLISDKEIILHADKSIQVSSQNAGVSLSADSSLSLRQGCAKIEMNQEIRISGGKIYMN